MKKIYIALFATFTFINGAVCTPVDNAKKLIKALNEVHDQNSAHEFSEEGQKLDREHQEALKAHDIEEQKLIQLHKTELKKHDEEERQKLTEDRDRELNLHTEEKQKLDREHQEALKAHDMEEQKLIQLHETELKNHDEEERQKLSLQHQNALKQHEEKRQKLIDIHEQALSKHEEKGQLLSKIYEKRIVEHKQKTEDLAQKHKQLLIDHQTKRQQLIDTHKKNLEDKKQIITTKHDVLKKDPDRIFLTTITHHSKMFKNELISHEELEQVLNIVYALCNANAPTYDKKSITLNDAPEGKLKTGEALAVSTFCDEIKQFYKTNNMNNAYNIIVFDEMFFSQSHPLTDDQKTFIEDKIKLLSSGMKNTFFYVNFLYTQTMNVKNSDVHSAKAKIASMQISTASKIALENNILNTLKIPNDHNIQNQIGLRNETCTIHDNSILTRYKKATYFKEADDYFSLKALPVVFYDFGDGEDHGDHANSLCKVMLENISTEICFDLPKGIREQNKWNNKDSKSASQSNLHIIQSNIVEAKKYKNNLPTDRYIAHSDRVYGNTFYKDISNKLNSATPILKEISFGNRTLQEKYKIEIHEIK